MWHDTIRPEDVKGRAETSRLLPHDPSRALKIARSIHHPWYRCQALTAVAEAQHSVPLLIESFATAYEQTEPNRIVSVASWPLRQLALLEPKMAQVELEKLINVAATEEHGLRRLHALEKLFFAVASAPLLRQQVPPAFNATAAVCQGWRAERSAAFVGSYLAKFDVPLAEALLRSRVPNRFAKHALLAIYRREAGDKLARS